MRRFDDAVYVRSNSDMPIAPREPADAEAPAQFIWRGKLYVVREVLSRWRERSAWWEHAAVAAVHGDATDSQREPKDDSENRPTKRRVLEIGDLEREVFRVEASVGRTAGIGVYDLARSVAPGTAAVAKGVSEGADTSEDDHESKNAQEWQLLRVSD